MHVLWEAIFFYEFELSRGFKSVINYNTKFNEELYREEGHIGLFITLAPNLIAFSYSLA